MLHFRTPCSRGLCLHSGLARCVVAGFIPAILRCGCSACIAVVSAFSGHGKTVSQGQPQNDKSLDSGLQPDGATCRLPITVLKPASGSQPPASQPTGFAPAGSGERPMAPLQVVSSSHHHSRVFVPASRCALRYLWTDCLESATGGLTMSGDTPPELLMMHTGIFGSSSRLD